MAKPVVWRPVRWSGLVSELRAAQLVVLFLVQQGVAP